MTLRFDRPIAHRGLHDRAAGIIENSMSAFAAAIDAGYAIECDVQLTRDHVAVVFHDDDLRRLIGQSGRVIERAAAELAAMPLLDSAAGEAPPTFTTMLARVAGKALLQVELKRQPTTAATEALAHAVVAALASYAGPVVLESFDPALLIAARRAGARVPLGIITYAYDQPSWEGDLSSARKFALRHLLHYPLTRFDFVSCRAEALRLPAVRLARALGLPVTAWTVRSEGEAAMARPSCDQLVFEGFRP